MAVYGYARVSTVGQTLATQMKAGVERLYAEKASGKDTKRPELERLLARLDEGDVLIVTKLDRLTRSTRDLLNIIDHIERDGAKFRSLQDAVFDTATPTGKLARRVYHGDLAARHPRRCELGLPPTAARYASRRAVQAPRGGAQHLALTRTIVD